MSSQVLTNQASALDAWVRLLRGHASATRAMSAQLVAEHGLTINDYECLLYLAHAEEGRVRRVDLAEQLILTASGVTRLLDGLEQAGWVERASCASDRRVTYAVLTASRPGEAAGGGRLAHRRGADILRGALQRRTRSRPSPGCSAGCPAPARRSTKQAVRASRRRGAFALAFRASQGRACRADGAAGFRCA